MLSDPAQVAGLAAHADYTAAAPTPEHFIPLLYLAGLASAAGKPAEILVDGHAFGAISMTAYTFDHRLTPTPTIRRGTAPMPPDVPPDDTNPERAVPYHTTSRSRRIVCIAHHRRHGWLCAGSSSRSV